MGTATIIVITVIATIVVLALAVWLFIVANVKWS